MAHTHPRAKTTDMTNPKCLNVIHHNISLYKLFHASLSYLNLTNPHKHICCEKKKKRMADTHLSIETTYITYPICYTMMLPNMPFRKADAHPLRLNTRCKDLTLVPSIYYDLFGLMRRLRIVWPHVQQQTLVFPNVFHHFLLHSPSCFICFPQIFNKYSLTCPQSCRCPIFSLENPWVFPMVPSSLRPNRLRVARQRGAAGERRDPDFGRQMLFGLEHHLVLQAAMVFRVQYPLVIIYGYWGWYIYIYVCVCMCVCVSSILPSGND